MDAIVACNMRAVYVLSAFTFIPKVCIQRHTILIDNRTLLDANSHPSTSHCSTYLMDCPIKESSIAYFTLLTSIFCGRHGFHVS